MVYGQKLKELFLKHGILDTECGSEVGNGWIAIIDDMFEELISKGWNKDLVQIKSKFCQLCVYTDSTMPADLKTIVEEAKALCNMACEDCGKLHNLTTPRSGKATCKECENKWREAYDKSR